METVDTILQWATIKKIHGIDSTTHQSLHKQKQK
jgi:hypothetical protein